MTEVIIILFLEGFDLQKHFDKWFWFQLNNLGLVLDMAFEFYASVSKGLKLKVRTFFGVNFYFYRSYRRVGFKIFQNSYSPYSGYSVH